MNRKVRTAIIVVALLIAQIPLVLRLAGHPATPVSAAVADPNIILGPDKLDEPFNCWTDGPFSVFSSGGKIWSTTPVNDTASHPTGPPCDQWIWSGSDLDHLVPTTQMTGITANAHTDKGRTYDATGWWPMNIYVDSAGTWHSYMHTEDASDCSGVTVIADGSDLRTIAEWTSTNSGSSWTYQGVVLDADSARFPSGLANCSSERGWPKNAGTGDQKLVVDHNGLYLYLLYTNFTYYPQLDNSDLDQLTFYPSLAIARTPLTNGVPGTTWSKYYNGVWTQPGVGGHESYLQTGYVNQPPNSERSVIWDTYLGEYVMAYSSSTSIRMAFSTDLINWTSDRAVYTPSPANITQVGSGIAYTNMVSTDSLGTDQSAGRTLWLYWTNSFYEVHRRWVAFDDQANLAVRAPVTTDTAPYGPAVPTGLTDEDLGSGYSPDIAFITNVNTAWVYVNLGSSKTFNEVRLQPANYGYGFPNTFEIDGSNDASTWTALATYSGYPQPVGGDTQIFSVASSTYQYVRVYATRLTNVDQGDASFKFRLNEFQVFNDIEGVPSQPTPPTGTAATYTASAGFSGTQGNNNWYYDYLSTLDVSPNCQDNWWNPLVYISGSNWWREGSTYAIIASNYQSVDAATAVDSQIATGCTDPAAPTTLMPLGLDTARVWRAPAAGSVHITGTVKKQDTTGGDGVLARIQINRTTIWPTGGASGSGAAVTYTTSSPFKMTDTNQNWTSSQWVGALITAGSNISVPITASTATSITVASWPNGTPTAGSPYTITPTWQAIAYNDTTGYAIDQYAEVQPGDRIYFIVNMHQSPNYDTTTWDPTVDYKPVTATYTASTGFSSTQGANQWSYQYYNGSTFTNMTWNSSTGRWNDPGTFCLIGKDWQSPDANLDSVRVWTAPSSGVATVQARVKKGDITGGDADKVKVMKNGVQIWPSGNTSQTLAYDDPYGYAVNVTTPVNSGDQIQFLVNYGADINYDTDVWDPTVIFH